MTKLPGKYTYHAEIREGRKLLAKLPGRYNTKQQLDDFVAAHWRGPLKYIGSAEGQITVSLKITKYLPATTALYIEAPKEKVYIE